MITSQETNDLNQYYGRGNFKIKFSKKYKWDGNLWLLHANSASYADSDWAFVRVHCVSICLGHGVSS